MKLAQTLLLALVPATIATGQTAPVAKKAVPHRSSTSTASTLPPNIPKVAGITKSLYSLRYTDVVVGTGQLAEPQKFYTVKYTGWLAKDGTKFDSSYDHPEVAEGFTFPYGAHRVIPGWDTGFEGMHVGGKRRLFIPWQLAYGEIGHPPVIPGKSDLIFDIELVSFSDKQPAPRPQPAAPDSTAKPAPDPTKPSTDPATNDPAKATTPDNATKPAPRPSTNPPGL